MRFEGVLNADVRSVRGVAFDIGGVLSLPDPDQVLTALSRAGVDESPQYDRFIDAHYRGVRAMAEAHTEPFDIERSSNWEAYDRAYARCLGLDESRWWREISKVFRAGGHWTLPRTEAICAIRRLDRAGLPLAVISNNNGTASRQLYALAEETGCDLLRWFDVVVDSQVVGYSKPDPRIFLEAADAISLTPESMIYVGDTIYADVVGAHSAGMRAVQLDPLGLHLDMGHGVCSSVSVLVEQILVDREGER